MVWGSIEEYFASVRSWKSFSKALSSWISRSACESVISCSPGFSRGKPELEELPDGTIVDVELMFKDEVLPGGDNLSRAILLGSPP